MAAEDPASLWRPREIGEERDKMTLQFSFLKLLLAPPSSNNNGPPFLLQKDVVTSDAQILPLRQKRHPRALQATPLDAAAAGVLECEGFDRHDSYMGAGGGGSLQVPKYFTLPSTVK